ncbi:intraflagellar transport protein 22 homolog [Venturia canescens]|uniref:intraflagellar transport protein 22 homolog n=1 Tax=Venturia canescens TaxID=32260 RepID=UPI001C9C65D4|nr:intraflagellar transport protein 22 homolog [Venturia canescens]
MRENKVGKTTISNYLADATDMQSEYRPTKGVRILEFEVSGVKVKNVTSKVDVELWDCSGDRKYENCWAAMRKDAIGVIFVNGRHADEHHLRDLERMYDYFVAKPKIEPKSCVVFHYDLEKVRNSETTKNFLPSIFGRISQVACNVDEGGAKLKTDFLAFLSTLTTRRQEKTEQEERNIMRDTGGIFPLK